MSKETETAILAGGCFWGMQDLIRRRPASSRPGRLHRWDVDTPPIATTEPMPRRSRSPSTPADVLSRALEFFFQIHDPRRSNRQGNDVGASYRSAIFYLDDEQRQVAEDTIADVEASGLGPARSSPK